MNGRAAIKQATFQLLRLLFRLTPMPGQARDRWRRRFLDRHASLLPGPVAGHPPADTTDVHVHRLRTRADARAIGYRERTSEALPETLPATLVAFYLPQFHPIQENDAWWGAGFTEWRNVSRALPQFEGHQQPRIPADLGYYDLRSPAVLREQAELAKAHGIGAFCSYFYWFGGRTLLETPLQNWLDDPGIDFPICMCWANESWSRRWDGRAAEILIEQQHGTDDDIAFIAHVARYLADPRYLRVERKPMLLVYRPSLLPDAKATAVRWRTWCRQHGIGEIHLAYVQSFDRVDPRSIGFDAAVEFPPNNTSLAPITARQHLLNPDYRGEVFDWRELARRALAAPEPAYPRYPGVTPGWDNEPRRSGNGRVLLHASPRGYRDWLRGAVDAARRRFPTHPMVFINAWNEWAEGAVLEPDTRLGHAWLDATRDALGKPKPPQPRPCAVVHAWYPEVLGELLTSLKATGIEWRVIITTAPERESAVRSVVNAQSLTCEIVVMENRGRDILPFLHVMDSLVDEGVGLVLKLHTKRSSHRGDGDQWRKELVSRLLPANLTNNIIRAFDDDQSMGLAAADGHLQPLAYYWGANEGNVRYLCRRIGIPEPRSLHTSFVAGSMFWVRPSALRPLLDTNLADEDFEPEAGQVDGTMAHAVERLFTLTVHASGAPAIRTTRKLCGLRDLDDKAPYQYAKRSD